MSIQKSKSILWYLLPITMAIIGGVISYFVLRKSDSRKAKNCLIIGVGLTVICLTIQLLINSNFIILPNTESGQYIAKYGVMSVMGETSIFAIPIVLGYYFLDKRRNRK